MPLCGYMKLPGASRTPPPTSPHVRGVGGDACIAPQISTYPMRADDEHRPLQNEGRDIWPRRGQSEKKQKALRNVQHSCTF